MEGVCHVLDCLEDPALTFVPEHFGIPMREQEPRLVEARWPVVLAILAMFFLFTTMPYRVRVFPHWTPWAITLMVTVPLIGVTLSGHKALWLRIERIAINMFLLVDGSWIIIELKDLLRSMVRGTGELSGLQLLTSSITVWAMNVVMFSIAYWKIDRGGPEARANQASTKPDWLFPQQGATEDAPPDWSPVFVDYLFLAFCTATAFSPTADLPLTSRAKLLMMLESTISLVTIVAVAARAINILGS
jgi:hypothetical protein